MENNSLFRQEVIANRLNRSLGTTRINVPVNFCWAGFFALGILFILAIFSYFGQVADKYFIKGYLDAENGVITVESEYSGFIDKIYINEGKTVKKGDVLYIISQQEKNLELEQNNNLEIRIANLKNEYQLKESQYKALSRLYNKKYISLANLKNVESELLELENRLKLAEYELLKFKTSQHQVLRAPIDGVVTNIFYCQGQRVQANKVLVQIIPKTPNLIVRLYVPSRYFGYVKTGQKINIKFEAYPSQRFGFYQAIIKEINKTILTDEFEIKPIKVGEPYYKITAQLSSSYVRVYGKKVALSHGLMLTGIITGEKKNIWRWILDPIYSYYGEKVV